MGWDEGEVMMGWWSLGTGLAAGARWAAERGRNGVPMALLLHSSGKGCEEPKTCDAERREEGYRLREVEPPRRRCWRRGDRVPRWCGAGRGAGVVSAAWMPPH